METALQTLIERIRAAAEAATPLRIRGGGTKDFYGQTLHGQVLDTRGLNGISAYEPSELVVTVGAGTPLLELEAALAAQGQCLPFEPPHFGPGATVGGMLGAGLSGPARASVGSVRDYVLGLEMVNGRGEHLTFGGQVMKNVAGYDVSRLLAGALGTLGLVTSVSLKVLPVPVAEATLRFAMDEATALKKHNEWAGQPLPLNASCWFEGQLTLRLRGALAAVQSACQRLGGERLAEAEAAAFWLALREQTHPFFALQGDESLWRLSVPDTAVPLQLGPVLTEWGGAQRWIKAPSDQAKRLRHHAVTAGGHATRFRGPDPALEVFTPLSPPLERIQRGLKQQFDPVGIFGHGRLYRGW
ncbi:glycolate oxidase subunit GlcE [Curvibacter sp. HBC28]|uniref:Glycolate oxidase subunit GlcE n=1 Tax=Curvibacter microcysteis TaxID=3026419 RepID=A0ABT5MB99_9BURK|nr:glycolate oxidase subunit GlcE [Curvibacter sp. HBC28]MDD0813845.1 glycolate oxidase subunit GlcE [Curvibacter sp. HBC28]